MINILYSVRHLEPLQEMPLTPVNQPVYCHGHIADGLEYINKFEEQEDDVLLGCCEYYLTCKGLHLMVWYPLYYTILFTLISI